MTVSIRVVRSASLLPQVLSFFDRMPRATCVFPCTRARPTSAHPGDLLPSLALSLSFFNVYLQLSLVVKYSLIKVYDMISLLLLPPLVDTPTQNRISAYPHAVYGKPPRANLSRYVMVSTRPLVTALRARPRRSLALSRDTKGCYRLNN